MAAWVWVLIWFFSPVVGLIIGTAIAYLTRPEAPLVAGLVVMVISVPLMATQSVAFIGATLMLAGAGICWGIAVHEFFD